MARVFIDGFEAGDTKLWDVLSGANIVASSGVPGMDGTYCMELLGISDYAQKILTEGPEYYVAFRYRCDSATAATYGGIVSFYNGATKLFSLKGNSVGGVFEAYAAALLASGGSFAEDVTYLIEVRYKPLNTGGVVQVKIDGILVIDYSGDTTAGAETITSVKFGYAAGTGAGYSYCWIDNVIIDNAAWPGNTKIQAVIPTGAGTAAQWTPSAGANYACVDEVPASETDYVQTNTVGHLDTYAAGDLVGTVAAVKCVQVQALAKAEGAPTPTNLQLAIRSDGTDYFSSDKKAPSASAQLSAIWETDPATAAAWLEAGVNAMEIGVKAVA